MIAEQSPVEAAAMQGVPGRPTVDSATGEAIRVFEGPDGRRLAYADTGGSGRPVLCLAGLTRNMRDFAPLHDHLAPGTRVIRLDSRGRGASERAADPNHEYAIPVETGDVLALIAHLGLERLRIVGTSRGGILGMAVAAGRPGLVEGLVLNDVGAVIEMRGLLRIFATLGRPPRGETFEDAAAELARQNAREFPDVPPARWLQHAHALYDDADGRPVLSYDPKLRTATAAALDMEAATITLWPLFEGLKAIPVLTLRGQFSDILSQSTLAEMAAWHPDFEGVEIPGRGHTPFLDEPAALEAIDRFLERT
ncbi:MAG: alpha/beta fold hydrolase [Paracoccaceae bacterium]